MKRGQRVLVRAYPDKKLLRVVLEEGETYVVVCRPEVYDEVSQLSVVPEAVMGFPKEDVVEVAE